MLFRKIYFRKQYLVMKNLSLRRQHKLKRNIQDNHSVSFSLSSSVSVRSTIHVYCVKFISLMTMHTKCFFFQTSCHLKEHILQINTDITVNSHIPSNLA